eukprot:CAMPEP_0183365076 /NCGR_PEP_ID=MMETSP0164_2-20130417/83270_1 /TAXON_ID=221442 /ORGANISM="Coccolithus pelagicus ssp braarudi, Strain PLY182g" /LENGTH=88 /DNA_ID=CAMNT_0025540529 /DNA_START=23 /DNA_END=289 /DNA_ORIENTATION=-
MASGAIAGVTAATTCFPIEVIRRRKMIGEFKGMGTFAAIASLARNEGAASVYRGVFLNMAKVSVSSGISFALYELFKDYLRVDVRGPV